MTFIYDVLLNFQDKNRLVEFFEWEDNDMLEHVKRIPLLRIPSVDMDHFCFSDVKVDKEFLNRIKGKVLLYKRKKTTFYGCLFCDLNRVVAVEFSSSGEIIARSCLLLDEEDEVIESAKQRAPHKIANYIQKLAQLFHSFYNDCYVIDENHLDLSSQRLALVKAAQITLKNALNLIGVNAPEKM